MSDRLHKALSEGDGVEDGGIWEDRAKAAEQERDKWKQIAQGKSRLPIYDDDSLTDSAPLPDCQAPEEAPDPQAVCVCGHIAHWHAAIIIDGEAREDVPQGAGECEGDPTCGCKRFEFPGVDQEGKS